MTIRKILFASAIAASALISAAPAAAQSKLPSPTVAVVDTEKVMTDCTACKAAQTQLQAQLTQMQQYAQQLAAPLQTEANSLDTAVKAANGRPDAALQTRIQQFQGKQQNAQRLVQEQEQTLQRNAQFVRQQIGQKLLPVIDQISKSRGASVTIDKGSLLFATPDLDITDGVLAALNQQLTSVNVVAPPQAPQGAAPQGAAPRPTVPAAGAKPTTTPPPGR